MIRLRFSSNLLNEKMGWVGFLYFQSEVIEEMVSFILLIFNLTYFFMVDDERNIHK